MVESMLSRGDGIIDGRAELMAKGAAESKGTAYLWQQVDAEGMAKAMGEVFPSKEEAASAGKMDSTGNKREVVIHNNNKLFNFIIINLILI